jgi:hypothetical protein
MVVANQCTTFGTCGYGNVAVLLGNGDGTSVIATITRFDRGSMSTMAIFRQLGISAK